MIVFVEGPRHSGKTFLLNKFFEQNTNPKVEYYKWYMIDWMKQLKIEHKEKNQSIHYLSLGNILTILDMMKDNNSKILVFDRALITAYVWAGLRDRMLYPEIKQEIRLVLESPAYVNARTIFVDPNPIFVENNNREKDMWDQVEFKAEYAIMDELMLENRKQLHDATKGNRFYRFHNEFNNESVESFVGLIDSFTDLINS